MNDIKITADWRRLAQSVAETHAEVSQVRRLLEGDPADPMSRGLKQIVNQHEEVLKTVKGRLVSVERAAWGILVTAVTAFVTALVYAHFGVHP